MRDPLKVVTMNMNLITAAGVGAVITLALLLAMDGLIRLAPGYQTPPEPRPLTPFASVREDSDLIEDHFEKPKINDPVDPPPPEPITDHGEQEVALTVPQAPVPQGPTNGGTTWLPVSDGPLVAMVRVSPTYPPRMAAKGIEGWVQVVFDVMADGTVTNIRIVESTHTGFHNAALKAAGKFRFKAPVVDGVPQIKHDVYYQFTFTMDEA